MVFTPMSSYRTMEGPHLWIVACDIRAFILAALIVVAYIIIPWFNCKLRLGKLPTVETNEGAEEWRKTYLQSASKLYRDGYHKFKDQIWVMPTSDGRKNVVVPGRFLPELNKLPEMVLSFPAAIKKVLEVRYTGVDPDEPIGPYCVRADLNPALSRLSPILNQEIRDVLKNEIPACEDWTPVFIFPKLVKVIAQVSGRIFVGSELCHDKDYLDTAINYTTELIDAMKAIKRMNPWLRPFLASRLPQVQRVNEREELAVKFFEPIVQARREAAKNPDYQKPDDMLQWFLNRSDQCKSQSLRHIVKMQLLMIFAGIHNTTVTTTNILYNLAVTPDYIPPLREEIQTVIGDNGGVLTSRALQQLEKLDSYMKETLRFHPPEITSFSRQAVGGITLSNGQYIPSGSFIETPAHAIYQDNATFPDSDTFDGFRFYKIRQGGSAALGARNQFVTSNEQNLVFGYGKHACPGRFLAAAEIKMILSKILLEYDFKVVGDETKRYQNYELGRVIIPEVNKPLLFKRAEA